MNLSLTSSGKYGPFFALASAVAFGLSTPVAKILIGSISPWALASILYLGSGLGLSAILLAKRLAGQRSEGQLSSADLPWLMAVILFGGVAGPLFLLWGLTSTDAASASLLLNLESVFTLLLAWIAFREHVDTRLLLGAATIVAAAVLLSWQGSLAGAGRGAIFIALACLCWGIDNNLTRNISNADPFLLAAIKGVVAGVVNGFLFLSFSVAWPSVYEISAGLALGFVSYGLGLVLFIVALRHLGTARTGAYYGTAPFIGALAAAAFLGERLTPTISIAGLMMAFGVWLHLTERHFHAHVHEELDHTHPHRHDEHHQHEHGPYDPQQEPHTHFHRHKRLAHAHAHWPDFHHRHVH